MAPKRGESIEHTSEHDDFLKKLTEFHEKRETTLDSEPKVGSRHVDLLKLYKRVTEEGGYDLCSDTKAKPLMWRKLAEEFIGKNQYTAAQAFQIKNVYYKNLCAYEIRNHWNKDPPPKEILEDVTAKGGNVMGRTLENFQRPSAREAESLQNGDESPEQQQTPNKDEKGEAGEDPGSAAGRTTRGLRQQPPQRVLFQPEITTGRRNQQPNMPNPAPTPGAAVNSNLNASILSNGASSTLASYEPSQSYPLSLKPVITPSNNPEYYNMERKRKAEATAGPLGRKYRHIMLPGTGFVGPNIYVRAQLALQSGIPEEEEYGLHHLVKISHERGDKYRFDQFPGLAEALIKKTLQVTSLFYDVEWDVDYDEDADNDEDETLDGLNGTSNVMQKLLSRMSLVTNDSLHDEEFVSQMGRITEAALILRNMCLQAENAQYMSRQPLARDFMTIVLNLPRHPSTVELRYHVLDIVEQILLWCDLSPHDALYQSLLDLLESQDRGILIAALKIIPRIGMNLARSKKLENVSIRALQRVQDWLTLDDEELRSACLDFLFQYTSFADNVERLLVDLDTEALAVQLSRLLLFAAKEHKEVRPPPRSEEDRLPAPVPRLSRRLVESLLKQDEPERSSEWLRMCFLADPASEMTQISLWQGYQGAFGPFSKTHPHLVAGDFIKNVSTTFPGATAQVAGGNKYVIKGIKARKAPIDTGTLSGSRPTDKGRELERCRCKTIITSEPSRNPMTGLLSEPSTKEVECSEWFKHSSDMLRHILSEHLELPSKTAAAKEDVDMTDSDTITPRAHSALANGSATDDSTKTLRESFDFVEANKTVYKCRWASCNRTSAEFESAKTSRTALFVRHVNTHLPDTEAAKAKHNVKPNTALPLVGGEKVTFITMTDERGEAAGVAMGAAMVLRNIAKFLPKELPQSKAEEMKAVMSGMKADKAGDDDLLAKVFDDEVKERLFFAVAYSKTMQQPSGNVLRVVRKHGTGN